MKKVVVFFVVFVLIFGFGTWYSKRQADSFDTSIIEEWAAKQEQEQQIRDMLKSRIEAQSDSETGDPFGNDDIVKLLFIGMDNRAGQKSGHCDAIQFIEINRVENILKITAVPRGTYAPLPGFGYSTGDFYVSNSCAEVSLEYGIKQIERIIGDQADYVMVIGFSGAIGVFRQLKLPATETMQWLRHRQGYTIGEPQRARNHSTFIKTQLIEQSPRLESKFSLAAQYIVYKLLRTDLSFDQVRAIANEIEQMDLNNNPDRIQLYMKPAYNVQDIDYDPEHLDEELTALIQPIARVIPEGAYTAETMEDYQKKIFDNIENGINNPDFVKWSFDNYLWFQIENDQQREEAHYLLLTKYLALIDDAEKYNQLVADYIIEMENSEQKAWAEKGKQLLTKEAEWQSIDGFSETGIKL